MCLQHPTEHRIATPLGSINYPTVGPPKMCGNKLCTRHSGFVEAQIMWALLKLQVTPSRLCQPGRTLTHELSRDAQWAVLLLVLLLGNGRAMAC